MPGAFVRFNGASSANDGSTVSIRLERDDGTEERLTFSSDLLDELAIHLLEAKAAAEYRAQAGVPTSAAAGERFVARAIQIAELQVDIPDQGDKIVLNFWNANQAHFRFSLKREFVHLLRTRLARI
jgi:hypothetical protein